MPDRTQKCLINFGGGWATDFGPSFIGAPQGNALTLPFLLRADNITYELDGAPHKVGGASLVNGSPINGGDPIAGLFDFWLQGTGGIVSEKQQAIAVAGTQIYNAPSNNGVWTSIKTGWTAGKEPCFEVFTSKLIVANNSNNDKPQSWDGSAASTSDLAGSPPLFSYMVLHKNRLFASGVASNPSRLYYSESLDPTIWNSGTAGSIDINPDDGDRITGLISHKNDLIIFKGPNRLSVSRMTGSAPTGADAFAIVPFVTGVGSVNHNGIFRINDDVVFGSPRGIHSMAATVAYGNYVEAFLSRPILSYYQNSLNLSQLPKMWGVNNQPKGLAIWTVAPSGSTTKSVYLGYDYRFTPGRWFSWGQNTAYVNANCMAMMQNNTSRAFGLYVGTTGGYQYLTQIANRQLDFGTAYSGDVLTPYINFGTSSVMKNAHKGYWSIKPQGSTSFTFTYTRDSLTGQQVTIPQAGGDTLG